MTNLIINRVNYILSEEHPNLYLSKVDNLVFRMQFIYFKQRLTNRLKDDTLLEWLKGMKDDDYIYYSFIPPTFNDFLTIKPESYPFNYFKAKFIREQLINFFNSRNFLVEPFPKGNDLSVYEKIDDFNNEWSIYRRYDLLVRTYKEIAFNIGSEKTLISNQTMHFETTDKIRIIDKNDNFIKPLAGKEGVNDCRIIANKQKREELGVSNEPRRFNYKNLYNQLIAFYNNYLLSVDKENFKIEAGGLKNVEQTDLNKVNINENLMLFGKEKTDINAVTGMRDYGIYKPSPKATDVKFIFVYENSRDANQLYLYLKNGLKHYPGLWSYVGVPIRLSDLKLQYDGTEDLKNKIDEFISENLPNEYYNNLFTIVINPNSSQEKEEIDEDENPAYYTIKRKFLEKGIPTQFIQDKNIHSGSFHYFLPNISIGILAKLGGMAFKDKKNGGISNWV